MCLLLNESRAGLLDTIGVCTPEAQEMNGGDDMSRAMMLWCCGLIATCAVAAGSAEAPATKQVNPHWLAQNLASEGVRIVDIRSDMKQYWAGNIPGAVYLHFESLSATQDGVAGKLLPARGLATLLGHLGINRQSTVIVYGGDDSMSATYLIWALDYLGHESSALLTGGYARWVKENRPTTQDYPSVRSCTYVLPKQLDNAVVSDTGRVERTIHSGDAVLLDVRVAPMFAGQAGPWKRKGRIPGAVNRCFKMDVSESGVWRAREELAAAYAGIGVDGSKPVMAYCGRGRASAQTYFVLRYVLGLPDVSNYDGSFSDWSSVDSRPVDGGPEGP